MTTCWINPRVFYNESPWDLLNYNIRSFQMESSSKDIHENLNAIIDYQTHHRLRETQVYVHLNLDWLQKKKKSKNSWSLLWIWRSFQPPNVEVKSGVAFSYPWRNPNIFSEPEARRRPERASHHLVRVRHPRHFRRRLRPNFRRQIVLLREKAVTNVRISLTKQQMKDLKFEEDSS